MITLVFSTNRWPLAALIRWGTRSEWSHVDVLMDDKLTVVGALGWGGVKRRPLVKLSQQSTRIGFAEVHGADDDAVWDFLADQIGKPYDWSGIVGFGANRDWQNDSSWFCSELVAAALKFGGVTVAHETAGRITPRDLWVSPALVNRRAD